MKLQLVWEPSLVQNKPSTLWKLEAFTRETLQSVSFCDAVRHYESRSSGGTLEIKTVASLM